MMMDKSIDRLRWYTTRATASFQFVTVTMQCTNVINQISVVPRRTTRTRFTKSPHQERLASSLQIAKSRPIQLKYVAAHHSPKNVAARLPYNSESFVRSGFVLPTIKSMISVPLHVTNGRTMNILVIEDDRTIGKSLMQGFHESGHECAWAINGKTGLEKARSQQADVIVLDLMLPEIPGMDVLSTLREEGINTPVVILTAKGAVQEKVDGLQSGADDYLVKPFAFAELKARVEAVCRRSSDRPSPELTTGDLKLDLSNHRAYLQNREIELTPTEFSIIELLMRHDGQVVTRKMLCEHVWGFEWDGPTNVIEVHVTRLRKKLGRDGQSRISTVRGRGYSINATTITNTSSANNTAS
jgi:two-component system OmpR family response regulator/two-component system copper resistance phosphate regulon response regulator CusR